VLVFNFTYAHALGGLVVLSALLLKTVTDHKFPKQQDLFKEMHETSLKLNAISLKQDEIESDITALKFGAMRK
jgi:hypothetical protein